MEQITNTKNAPRRSSASQADQWDLKNRVGHAAVSALAADALTGNEFRLLKMMAVDSVPLTDGRLICTRPVGELAKMMAMCRQSIHRLNLSLEAKGFIRDMSNSVGYRGVSNGHWYGIDVSPALTMKTEFDDDNKLNRQTARASTKVKENLRGIKAELRRSLQRLGRSAGELWHRGMQFLARLPVRYDEPDAVLAELEAEARDILQALCEHSEQSCVTPMRHGRNTAEPLNTDTNKEDIKSNTTFAKTDFDCESHHVGKEIREKRESRAPTIGDALNLTSVEEKAMIQEYFESSPKNKSDHAILSDAVQMLAVQKWHEIEGDERILGFLFNKLGHLNGSILLLLMADRASNPDLQPVQSLSKYAASCISKCALGSFNWIAGIKSAATRVDSPMATAGGRYVNLA